MAKVKVELWSEDPSAVAAVRNTISMLPGGGSLLEEGGAFYLEGPEFVAWACEHQGYVRRVLPEKT
jgi:hypothetical protein